MDSCTGYSGARSRTFRKNGARKRRVGCTECSRHLPRRALLPPSDGQSEAFSRRVCANGAAQRWAWSQRPGKFTPLESDQSTNAPPATAPGRRASLGGALHAEPAPPRCLPLRFLHQKEQRHHHPVGTNYPDEDNKSNGGGGGGVLTIPPQRPQETSKPDLRECFCSSDPGEPLIRRPPPAGNIKNTGMDPRTGPEVSLIKINQLDHVKPRLF